MVAMHVTYEYPHLPVDAGSRVEELALSSFTTVEEKKFRAPPYEYTR